MTAIFTSPQICHSGKTPTCQAAPQPVRIPEKQHQTAQSPMPSIRKITSPSLAFTTAATYRKASGNKQRE
jgi:hypothetical protein